MTGSNTEEIILQAIERLIERDNPSLETMKMQVPISRSIRIINHLIYSVIIWTYLETNVMHQVDYDTSFLQHDTDAQRTLRMRNKTLTSHKVAIVEVVMEDASDFEALTVLYRKIFRFLLDFAPKSKGQDRQVEREVAAALESVFPRVGLKTFVSLSYDEKSSQLAELAKIVLGIRLFNRDQSRGGAGIDNMDREGSQLASTMLDDVNNEAEYFSDACHKYQLAIVKAQLLRRRADIIQQKRSASESNMSTYMKETSNLIPIKLVERWLKELANRRQYLGFLRTLQDEMKNLQVRIAQICENIREELVTVQHMVTNRASVSKELVYPRFDSLGALWICLFEEVTILLARSNTFGVLCKYRLSFTPTLDEKYYISLLPLRGDAKVSDIETDLTNTNLSLSDVDWSSDGYHSRGPFSLKMKYNTDYDSKKELMTDSIFDKENGNNSMQAFPVGKTTGTGTGIGMAVVVDGIEINQTTDAGATLLSVHNTPDFLLLPLELQGYCPWTMVHAHGLLLPGKPALGVVRYENMYYVCEHTKGMKYFMEDPEYYLKSIRTRALGNPEYIHLLRLQRWFPSASIARLLEQDDYDSSSVLGRPVTKDASTGTPIHFIESYIDIDYHWNEWELRRRALKIANLTNCTTTSQQTDNSHFRRDNDAQVYELRDRETQTKRDKGTNPPIVTTYIAGMRGKPAHDATAVSKYVRNRSEAKEEKDHEKKGGPHPEIGRARVITLTLDL